MEKTRSVRTVQDKRNDKDERRSGTMMIRVKMFGRFRHELWECREIGAKSGASALEVLQEAVPRDSIMFPEVFDAEERIKNHIIIVRNGTRMTRAEYDGLPLKDSDEIAVLPPVAGG